MKILNIMILSHLISLTIHGQEIVNNFQADNKEIIWVKVFVDSTMTFDKLTERIKESGLFIKMDIADNKITGETKEIDADFKGAGYSEMSTPIYISRSHINGFVVLEFKDGRYRVTLKKIVLTQKYNDPLTKQGEKTTIETFGLKKGENVMTSSFKKSPSLILNYTFSNKFEFKKLNQRKDW